MTIEQLRSRIATLYAEKAAIERNVFSRAEMSAHIKQSLAEMRESVVDQAARRLLYLAHGHKDVRLVSLNDDGSYMINEYRHGETHDAFAAFILGAAGEKALLGVYAEALGRIEGLFPDKAARDTRLAEVNAELDKLEREEERFICEQEERGFYIDRRENSRPSIVLELIA